MDLKFPNVAIIPVSSSSSSSPQKSPLKAQISNITHNTDFFKWHGDKLIAYMMYTYLFKKYNNNCDLNKYDVIPNDNYSKYGSVGLTIDDIHYTEGMKQHFEILSNKLANCYHNNIIIIPINIIIEKEKYPDKLKETMSHANVLILRPKPNDPTHAFLEHFEPQSMVFYEEYVGKDFVGNSHSNLVRKFTEVLNATFNGKINVQYIHPTQTCPISKWGPQDIQSYLFTDKDGRPSKAITCQLWSIIVAELCITNPSYTMDTIVNSLIHSMHNQDNIKHILNSYIAFIENKTEKYFKDIFEKYGFTSKKIIEGKPNEIDQEVRLKLYYDLYNAVHMEYIRSIAPKKNNAFIKELYTYLNGAPIEQFQHAVKNSKILYKINKNKGSNKSLSKKNYSSPDTVIEYNKYKKEKEEEKEKQLLNNDFMLELFGSDHAGNNSIKRPSLLSSEKSKKRSRHNSSRKSSERTRKRGRGSSSIPSLIGSSPSKKKMRTNLLR